MHCQVFPHVAARHDVSFDKKQDGVALAIKYCVKAAAIGSTDATAMMNV